MAFLESIFVNIGEWDSFRSGNILEVKFTYGLNIKKSCHGAKFTHRVVIVMGERKAAGDEIFLNLSLNRYFFTNIFS